MNIIRKIFEAYKEEYWNGSSDDFGNAITKNVRSIVNGIHFKLKYSGFNLAGNIKLFRLFSSNQMEKFETLNIIETLNREELNNWRKYVKIYIGEEIPVDMENSDDVQMRCTHEGCWIELDPVLYGEDLSNEVVIDLYIAIPFIKCIENIKKEYNFDYWQFPSGLFNGIDNLVEVIEFPDLSILHNEIDLSYIFGECSNLIFVQSIGDMSKVVSFEGTFWECKNLEDVPEIDLTENNMLNLNMSYMFCECRKLQYVNIKGDKKVNHVDIRDMFYNCWRLKDASLFISPQSVDNFQINTLKDKHRLDRVFFNCNNLSEKTVQEWEIGETSKPFNDRLKTK